MRPLVLIAAAALLAGCHLYTELDRPDAVGPADVGGHDAGPADMDAVSDAGADSGGDDDMGDAGDPGCVPQTDLQFCNVNGVDCGEFTGFDNCEQSRTISCGMCEQGVTCGEQAPNVCGCPCDIDGTCLGLGAINPNDTCQVCDPAKNANGWSITDTPECTLFPAGETVRIDLGPTAANGWPRLENDTRTEPLTTVQGNPTSSTAQATDFNGDQTGGSANNDLGWPVEVSSDTLWVGTFAGHQEALAFEGYVRFEGLPEGQYDVRIFASRTGNDGGAGRLTQYEVAGVTQDLDAQNNTGTLVTYTDVASTEGAISIAVRVSPDGMSRFGYIGAVELQRTQ